MKRGFFLIALGFLFLFFLCVSCSRKSSTEPEEPQPRNFTLYVQNNTQYNIYIFVNGDYVGICSANAKQNMREFSNSSNVHLEANDTNYYYYWETYVNTQGMEEYTWRLII